MKKQAGKNHTPVDTGRRRLMAGALGVSAAAGLGLVSINAQAESAPEQKPHSKETRYQETDHIRRYYRRAQEV